MADELGLEPPMRRPKCSGHLCSVRFQKNLAEPLHSCPYRLDVLGDAVFACDCCDVCRQQCADDV